MCEGGVLCVRVVCYKNGTFQCVLLHCLAEFPCDRGAVSHCGTTVDLNEPGLEVSSDHEICSIELKCVGHLWFNHVLCGLKDVDDSCSHARVDD